MADRLIFVVTYADDKADKATIPFALGNSALAMDAEATIILQSTGVFLGKKIMPATLMRRDSRR